MLLRDPGDGERERKNEIIAEASLVAGNEAQDDHFGLTVLAIANENALLDQRLADLSLNIRHEIAKGLERDHDFGGHQAWAQALHHHQLEAVLPFVLGD